MKKLYYFLLAVILMACVIPKSEMENTSDITLTNNITEVELTKSLDYGAARIVLENISAEIIIEISYNLNGNTYTLYDYIAPQETRQLYFTKTDDAIIDCKMIEAIFY